MCEEKRTVMQT